MGLSLGFPVHFLLHPLLHTLLRVVLVDDPHLFKVSHGMGGTFWHIPPSTPYVGPIVAYVGMQFGNTNAFGQGLQTLVSTPFMSSLFSLFSEGIPAPIFQTPVLSGAAQTTYIELHTNNPLACGWNLFQGIPTTSQPETGGNPTFTFGNQEESPSTTQARIL